MLTLALSPQVNEYFLGEEAARFAVVPILTLTYSSPSANPNPNPNPNPDPGTEPEPEPEPDPNSVPNPNLRGPEDVAADAADIDLRGGR